MTIMEETFDYSNAIEATATMVAVGRSSFIDNLRAYHAAGVEYKVATDAGESQRKVAAACGVSVGKVNQAIKVSESIKVDDVSLDASKRSKFGKFLAAGKLTVDDYISSLKPVVAPVKVRFAADKLAAKQVSSLRVKYNAKQTEAIVRAMAAELGLTVA